MFHRQESKAQPPAQGMTLQASRQTPSGETSGTVSMIWDGL
jgi:hypothetical protein